MSDQSEVVSSGVYLGSVSLFICVSLCLYFRVRRTLRPNTWSIFTSLCISLTHSYIKRCMFNPVYNSYYFSFWILYKNNNVVCTHSLVISVSLVSKPVLWLKLLTRLKNKIFGHYICISCSKFFLQFFSVFLTR